MWNWLWLLTHLGNHREVFSVVWTHLHQHALGIDTTIGIDATTDVLSTSLTLRRWIQLMSNNLSLFLQDSAVDTDPDAVNSSDRETDHDTDTQDNEDDGDHSPQRLFTQPPTPEPYENIWWSDTDNTDSENESLPPSLDTFLFETFRPTDTEP